MISDPAHPPWGTNRTKAPVNYSTVNKTLNKAVIGGSVVGVVAFLAAGLVVTLCLLHRRKKARNSALKSSQGSRRELETSTPRSQIMKEADGMAVGLQELGSRHVFHEVASNRDIAIRAWELDSRHFQELDSGTKNKL